MSIESIETEEEIGGEEAEDLIADIEADEEGVTEEEYEKE